MLDAIDRMMAVVAKGIIAAMIEGFAAYAGAFHHARGLRRHRAA